MLKHIFVTGAALVAEICLVSLSQASAKNQTNTAYSMPSTEQFSLVSKINAENYRIYVALPPSYKTSPGRKYPVLYTLDANGFFGTVRETAQVAMPSGALPEMIIVGVGYQVDGIDETYMQRFRDYAPTPTGGAFKFQAFLRNELIPSINAKYRTKPDDTALFGDSLGGAFALFTMFSQPDTFSRYIVGSPAVSWNDIDLFKMERDYSFTNPSLPVRVYVGFGTEESTGTAETLRMLGAIRSHRYANLWLKEELFQGADHISVIPMVIAHGLRQAFCDPPRETGCGQTEMAPLTRLP